MAACYDNDVNEVTLHLDNISHVPAPSAFTRIQSAFEFFFRNILFVRLVVCVHVFRPEFHFRDSAELLSNCQQHVLQRLAEHGWCSCAKLLTGSDQNRAPKLLYRNVFYISQLILG